MTTGSLNQITHIIITTTQIPTRHLRYYTRYFRPKRNANHDQNLTHINEYHTKADIEQLNAVTSKYDLTY